MSICIRYTLDCPWGCLIWHTYCINKRTWLCIVASVELCFRKWKDETLIISESWGWWPGRSKVKAFCVPKRQEIKWIYITLSVVVESTCYNLVIVEYISANLISEIRDWAICVEPKMVYPIAIWSSYMNISILVISTEHTLNSCLGRTCMKSWSSINVSSSWLISVYMLHSVEFHFV